MPLAQGLPCRWESEPARCRDCCVPAALRGGGLRLDSGYPLVCAHVQAGGDSVEFVAVEKVWNGDVVVLVGLVFN